MFSRRRTPAAAAAAIASFLALTLTVGACSDSYVTDPGDDGSFGELGTPENLRYQLIPSGDPIAPEGVLLRWDEPDDERVANYVVYSRASTTGSWSRRAETTSGSFHDAGIPHLQYYVASEDAAGHESRGSNTVTIEERNRLPAPASLASVTLDRAVQLSWADNARKADPTLFDYYRVYSTTYDLDAGKCSETNWVLEGSTVSEDFLVTGLANGAPRCFDVSTVSRDGHESAWGAPVHDTPRYDARNVLVDASQAAPQTSGFRFFDPSSQRFGVVMPGDRTDADFRLDRRADGTLWFVPVRADVKIALYSTQPVVDLTSIDVAPARSAFARSAIEAVPGYAYVFEIQLSDGLHYGAIRVGHAGASYVIFDWAYQSDYGNPELIKVSADGRT